MWFGSSRLGRRLCVRSEGAMTHAPADDQCRAVHLDVQARDERVRSSDARGGPWLRRRVRAGSAQAHRGNVGLHVRRQLQRDGANRGNWTPQVNFHSGLPATRQGACMVDDPNNVRVRVGTLQLTVRKVTRLVRCDGYSAYYTSGGVTTHDSSASSTAGSRRGSRPTEPPSRGSRKRSGCCLGAGRPRRGRQR